MDYLEKNGIIINRLFDDVYYLYNSNINSKVLVVSKDIADTICNYDEREDVIRSLRENVHSEESVNSVISIIEKYGILGDVILNDNPKKKRLVVWLGITNNCNLQCRYCYIEKSNINMENKTVDIIVGQLQEIIEERGYEELVVKFTGGEPLINESVLKYAVDVLNERILIKKHFEILTNGTLINSKLIAYFKEKNVTISVSLDGKDEESNSNRKDVCGNDYFNKVFDSVIALMENGVVPNIMLTINSSNLRNLPDITSFFIDNNLKFRFSLEKDFITGIPPILADKDYLIAQLNKSFDVMEEKLNENEFKWKFKFADVRFGVNRDCVCNAGRDYIAFSADGKIGCCGMGLSTTNIRIGEHCNPMNLLYERYNEWSHWVDVLKECKCCTWKKCCAGGCPLQNSLVNGQISKGVYCEVFKEVVPRLLRIEAIRVYRTNRRKDGSRV